jgi:hypothetical protein
LTAALVVGVLFHAAPAEAITLTLQSETQPYPGVKVRKYRTASPATNTWVALVDLCQDHIHLDATGTPLATQATGAWATAQGAQLATNGDFFKTGPVRVYGQAVGGGVAWPSLQTGVDPAYAAEWYFKDFGWIAFGPDWVDFSHTRQVKVNNPAVTEGYSPNTVVTTFPPDTLALLSGFPELVTEGTVVSCADPTAATCFPDRTDMRARNPRTAMGLTLDRRTFILAVVDGRTTTSAGVYGTELASLMRQLGAWQAFNVDGGGSSQFWVEGQGYKNDYNGNNSGTGLRAVANHWGVFAGTANGKPQRPGHCVVEPPCAVLPAEGGMVDNTSACFRAWGPAQWWRQETQGYGGGLLWTNASASDAPLNWAWWQLNLAQAGRYLVEYYATPAFAVFPRVQYEVRAGATSHRITEDQSRGAAGWRPLGEFDFRAGGRQWVRVNDNGGTSVPSGQRVVVDAVRLTRVTVAVVDAGVEDAAVPVEDAGQAPADAAAPPDGSRADAATADAAAGDAAVEDASVNDTPAAGDVEPACGCRATGGDSPWALLWMVAVGCGVRRGRRDRERWV